MLKEIFTTLIGNAIVAAGRAIKVHNLEIYAKHNFEITPEQYMVLNMIKEDEPAAQNKLGELLYKDKSNMARIIAILEEKNLIEKIQQTENKKQVNIIKITDEGRKMRSKITPIMNESRQKYLKDISEDEMYTCIKVLNKIQKNLEIKE